MNGAICFGICAILMHAPKTFGEPNPLRICVVQPKEGFADSQILGLDAKKLAPELSTRKLKNGTPIIGIPIVGMNRKDADVEVEHEKCSYTVKLIRYQNVDEFDTDSLGDSLARTHRSTPEGNGNSISYALNMAGIPKVILQGSAPQPIIYAKTHRQFTPFPLFAEQIVAKLNKLA